MQYRINSYEKIFTKNYLKQDYYQNYNMLSEQINNLNFECLENHISEIFILERSNLKL